MLACLEAFEYFVDPVTELKKLLKTSQNILLSTEFYPEPLPNLDEWWNFSMEHGHHIRFFHKDTFMYSVVNINPYFYTNGQNLHLLTENNPHHPPSSGFINFQKASLHLLKQEWNH